MNDFAIRVEDLSKQYRIGQRERYHTLRDSLARAFSAPARWVRTAFSRSGRTSDREWARADSIWALKDVGFEVKRGEVVGIIGRNGSGKSTLLKILSRITEPTTGEIEIQGRVGSLLEVGTGFHPELTGRENIFLNGAILGMKRAEIARKFDDIVAFAEIDKFLDTAVKHYSSGMYMRLAFAVAGHLEPEILIVDEVLAVGDAAFQKKCLGKMGEVAKIGRTVLFVSHNMAAIQRLCHHCILLDSGTIKKDGSAAEAIGDYLMMVPIGEARLAAGPLTEVAVKQINDMLEISARFRTDRPLSMVCLGFIIHDQLGNPVCGSNPRLQGLNEFGRGVCRGTVNVRMEYPKLRNGTYRMSVWLGDGQEDFCTERDCVAFEITDMCNEQPIDPYFTGSAAPTCQWEISQD